MGGSETYVLTVADHLQRLGHEVRLHAFSHGLATEQARELGVRIVEGHRLPKVALALGNYLLTPRLEMIGEVCAEEGIELIQIGATASGAKPSPIAHINEADVVFGKARVICEAMSCARAAYVLDLNGGE